MREEMREPHEPDGRFSKQMLDLFYVCIWQRIHKNVWNREAH